MIATEMASSDNFSLWGDIERHFRQQWDKDNKDRLGGYDTLTPAQIAERGAYLDSIDSSEIRKYVSELSLHEQTKLTYQKVKSNEELDNTRQRFIALGNLLKEIDTW